MNTITIIIIIAITITIIQEYVCWNTYKKWFDKNITYCKMEQSYSFIGMILLLPFFVWLPIFPLVVIYYLTDQEGLTIKWMFGTSLLTITTKDTNLKVWDVMEVKENFKYLVVGKEIYGELADYKVYPLNNEPRWLIKAKLFFKIIK